MLKQPKGRVAAGVSLIALGLVLYVLERSTRIDAAAVFLLLGGAFLAGYFYRREYGLLVPAGILLGLGLGTVIEQTRFDYGQPMMWGLGLGFVSIFVIGLVYQRNRHWWPLIPGVLLVLLGLPRAHEAVEFVFRNWPLLLVLAGVLILLGGLRGRRKPNSP